MTIADLRLIGDDEIMLTQGEQDFLADLNALRARRHSIYRDWRLAVIPSVTLEQGVWLLLGEDPLGVTPAAPEFRELRDLRFRELLNRLECAVAEGELRPIGKHVEGFPRRFRLAAIAATAARLGIAESHAEEIRGVLQEKPTAAIHHEAADLRKRAEAHKQFLVSLGEKFASVGSKPKTSRRRRTLLEPLDVQLAISRTDYNQGWRRFVAEHFPAMNPDRVSDAMLAQDRSHLNIRLRPGRKPSALRS